MKDLAIKFYKIKDLIIIGLEEIIRFLGLLAGIR